MKVLAEYEFFALSIEEENNKQAGKVKQYVFPFIIRTLANTLVKKQQKKFPESS